MIKKFELKEPKFKEGDILKYTNPISKKETIVILIRRYDLKPHQRVAWWYKQYPNGVEKFGAPENEFSTID